MRRSILYIIKVLLRAYSKYGWQILIMAFLGVLGGLLEGLGIGALIPLFSFVINEDHSSSDPVSKLVLAIFKYLPLSLNPTTILILMVFLFTGKTLALFIFNYINIRIIVDYRNRTIGELLEKLLHTRWPYALRQKLGYIQSILIRNVQEGGVLLTALSHVILSLTGFLAYFLVALNISPDITLITLGSGGVVIFFLRPLARRVKKTAQQMNALEKETTQYVSEHVIGMKTVKALGKENEVLKQGVSYLRKLSKLNIRNAILQSLSGTLVQPLALAVIAALFIYSYKNPGFNLAVFGATIYLVQRIFVNIEAGQRAMYRLVGLLPYVEDMIRFRESMLSYEERSEGEERFVFRERIDFKRVFFSYNEDAPVLDGINFSIKRGEHLGLIGPSGAGKTSIADLLLRFFDPTAGEILLDGVPISKFSLKEWRDHVGYMSQDIFLLNDTIENNIRFYSEELSLSDLEEAAREAKIYEFIQGLPAGWATVVGERGVMLSAGQRQRVALARVLARRPEILILDEATSALDNESELAIQQAIATLRGKVTVFIIAHRLSTIIDVDRLLVLDKGVIVEEGHPQKLLENPDSYFHRVYHLKASL